MKPHGVSFRKKSHALRRHPHPAAWSLSWLHKTHTQLSGSIPRIRSSIMRVASDFAHAPKKAFLCCTCCSIRPPEAHPCPKPQDHTQSAVEPNGARWGFIWSYIVLDHTQTPQRYGALTVPMVFGFFHARHRCYTTCDPKRLTLL